MVPVELVEGDGPDDGSPADPARGPADAHNRPAGATTVARAAAAVWRRPALRVVTLCAVAAVVAGLVVDAAERRTRMAAVADVTGTVLPLTSSPRTVYQIEARDWEAAASGVAVGGVVVGSTSDGDGLGRGVVGLDATTGAVLWRTGLGSAGAPGRGMIVGGPSCAPAAGLVACTSAVADPERGVGGIYWVLDPASGAVVRTESLGEHRWVEVVDGLLVVAEQVEGPPRAPAQGPWTVRWRVTGQDALSGAVAWTWTSPSVEVAAEPFEIDETHDPSDYASWVARLDPAWPDQGDDLLLLVGQTTWVLHADGTLRATLDRRDGWDTWTTTSGTLMRSSWDEKGEHVELLAADGSWRPLEGSRAWLSVDDGSAPGLVVLAGQEPGDAPLTGVDVRTGEVRWRLEPAAGGDPWVEGALLFGGTVYVGHGNLLQAVDAATGEVRWSVDGATWPTTTDGAVLLAHGGSEVATLVAYDLDDGHIVWSVGDRELAGHDDDGRARVVQGVTVLPGLRRVAAVWQDSTLLVLG